MDIRYVFMRGVASRALLAVFCTALWRFYINDMFWEAEILFLDVVLCFKIKEDMLWIAA